MQFPPNTIQEDKLAPLAVGINEAARLIGLSPHTIRAYERRGLIKATRLGARVLIPVAELRRLIDEGCRAGRFQDTCPPKAA